MRLFDVTGCTAQIVRPGMTLTAWAAQNRPFALCNASLYDFATRVPIGTIFEDGQLVHDDGNGYGIGVFSDQKLCFGTPFEVQWKDFLTGYNSPVQNGKYIEPTFQDAYVFGCRLARIGVGYRQGKTYLVTDDGVTLKEFAQNAISMGLTVLVNLDGGGSRHLLYNGSLIYQSPRVPYNALAFFKSKPCAFCTDDGRCVKWTQTI